MMANKENRYPRSLAESRSISMLDVSLISDMLRKRKRHRTDDDNISLTSLNSLSSVDINLDEPKKRRRSSLAKITSLSNLLSPKNHVKKVGMALQRSFSLKNLMSPNNQKAYKEPQPTPPKRRESTFWVETVQSDTVQEFSHAELERQEAIFELYKNEEDLIEDLGMVKQTYHDSMAKLKLLNEEELKQIFGPIDTLKPMHLELVEALREQRRPDGITDTIGQVLLDWVPRLDCYVAYCANQIYAKSLLDMKKQDPNVDDFLQRCQNSPFSRHLDLWSFLDVPRSRLVKYPLLFKAILKKTPSDHEDVPLIEEAIKIVEGVIDEVDRKTGESKCHFIRSKLEYLDEKSQKSSLLEESNAILCDGVLKNNRGTKLHVFLFEKILVLTRPATRGQNLKYQVYRQPIPCDSLVLDESGGSKSGSFRSAFTTTNANNSKMMFKVSFRNTKDGQSHTLQANDEHDKKQWVTNIKSVLKDHHSGSESGSPTNTSLFDPEEGAMRAKRRNSTSSEILVREDHDGPTSPSYSLRSANSSIDLSPLSLKYNVRRSTSRSMFSCADSDDDESCEFETKPITSSSVNYTIRKSLRRTSVESTMSTLSVNSPLSDSLANIPAVDDLDDSTDSLHVSSTAVLASPESDCISPRGRLAPRRCSSLSSVQEESCESTPINTPTNFSNNTTPLAGKKRKSLDTPQNGKQAKRRSTTGRRGSLVSLNEEPTS